MPTYLDHNATTPTDPRVLEAMLPYLSGPYANPSSLHRYGRAARDAVEQARAQVAALAGADAGQVVFTSGGTEANNLAVHGVASGTPRGRLLYSAIEHPCIDEPMRALADAGWPVETIAVDGDARIDIDAYGRQLAGAPVRLVSCMVANNETGTVQDTARLAGMARDAGAVFHADAVQAAGKLALSFQEWGLPLMTLSAHKIFGPKGVGALIVDRGLDITPQLRGGGQERGLRAGTENVAGIVGFGEAAALAVAELESRSAGWLALRERLEGALGALPGVRPLAVNVPRTPNALQFTVPGIHSATLLGLLDQKGYAVSSGSACASGSDEASPVLLAMGLSNDEALCAIRVSLGLGNTEQEIDGFVATLKQLLASMGLAMPAVVGA